MNGGGGGGIYIFIVLTCSNFECKEKQTRVCRDEIMFVTTNVCRDKIFLSRQKTCFVATNDRM